MFDGSPQALRDVAVGTNFGTKIIPFRGHAVVAYYVRRCGLLLETE